MKYINNKTLLALLSMSLLIVSCKQKNDEAEPIAEPATIASQVQLTDSQLKSAELETVKLVSKNVSQIMKLSGTVEVMPQQAITVSSPMAGFVRQIKWMPGMDVVKGQLLVRMEDQEFIRIQQEYLDVKNTLKYAKIDYERQLQLSKNQAASDKILQSAEEKVMSNQILLKSLSEKLKLININPASLSPESISSYVSVLSPVSGTITNVDVNTGKYVNAGDNMIQIVDKSGLRLVLKAFEKDLPGLSKGLKLVAYSNANPSEKMRGKIEYMVKNVSQDGFAKIICTFENSSKNIVPGMYMNAEVESENAQKWILPDEAIVRFEGKEFVFIDKGNKSYDFHEVKTGWKENGWTEIVDHESLESSSIVSKGAYTLLMKMKNVAE
ncbi:MAG: efflux RND transporter periplasmic adaptor subunit [Saprospiraceae bacterium]|nr:efflux RND transporter periplasmic adaptor subunit [Saprospiraceae bacterium]MBK8825231.1 efflux RND transporter periplasmic adaptor subunit [Saprospiraceae bacterium]MBP8213329.1 efflux RND transporter periplasmic adaptor subunit [Saprospiraceae bacterium]